MGASRDSGVLEFSYHKISAVKQWKPLRGSQSKNLNFFRIPQSLYWRPSADQKARGLWVRDWQETNEHQFSLKKNPVPLIACKNRSALAFSNTYKAGYFLLGCHFRTFYFRFKVKHAHKDRIPTFSEIKNSIIPESLLAPIR